MPKPLTLSQVSSTDDIIDQGRFLFLLGSIPGNNDTDDLTIRCFNCTIPGVSSEVMETPMHGHTLRFRGRKTQSSPVSCSFWEDSYFDTYSKLYDWSEYVTDTDTGNSGGFLADYSITSQISIFNTRGDEAARFMIYAMFLQDLTDISLSSESSSPLQIQAQFAFRSKKKVI